MKAKKHMSKKLLALLLSVLMIVTAVPLVVLPASAQISVDDSDSVYIVVPETIYLKPTSGNATEAQYYINNTLSGSSVTPDADAATTAKIYFKCPGAKNVTIEADAGGNKWKIEANNINGFWSDEKCAKLSENSYNNGNKTLADLTPGSLSWMTWNFTATMNDGSIQTFKAYSEIYAPFQTPVGAGSKVKAQYKGTFSTFDTTDTQGISWIAGIHSVGAAASSSSYDGDQYICRDKLDPLVGTVATGQQDVTAFWNTGTTFASQSLKYIALWDTSSNNETAVNSYIGNLTVDKSRYDNLKQIPNLKIGFLTPYTGSEDGVDGIDAYFSDYTDQEFVANNKHSSISWFNTRGTVLASDTTASKPYVKVIYNNKEWDRDISADSSKTYVTKAAIKEYSNKRSRTAAFNLYCHLSVTAVNKAALRNQIQACLQAGYQESWIASGSWSNYIDKLCNASQTLGNPMADGNTIETRRSELEAAFNALNLKTATAKANHYGVVKVLNSTGATTGYAVQNLISEESKDYKYTDTVSIAPDSKANYTYLGYLTSANKKDIGATFNGSDLLSGGTFSWDRGVYAVGNANTNLAYYYLAKDATVTIDPNGGVWNGSKNATTITGSVGSTFAPVAPTREHYIFNGWEYFGNGAITLTNSDINLKAQWELDSNAVHTWEQGTLVSAATCISPAIYNVKCTVCGYETTKEYGDKESTHHFDIKEDGSNVKPGHNGDGDAIHTITCTTPGCGATEDVLCTAVGLDGKCICSVCGQELEHTNVPVAEFQSATCQHGNISVKEECTICHAITGGVDDGKIAQHNYIGPMAPVENNNDKHAPTCEWCGIVSLKVLDEQDCAFGDWEEVTPATCSSKGTEKRVCSVCKREQTRDIEMLQHTATVFTALANGKHQISCSVCTKILDEAECTFSETGRVNATCHSNGTISYKCDKCTNVKDEAITTRPAHTYTGVEAESIGNDQHVYKCSVCVAAGVDENSKDFGKKVEDCSGGKTAAERYCDEQAICDACKTAYGANGTKHDMTTVKIDGNEEQHTVKCTRCDTQTTTANHNWGPAYNQVSDTCITDATETYKCQDCQIEKVVVTKVASHDFTGAYVTSTNEDGEQFHARECKNCEATGLVIDGKHTVNATEKCSGGSATCQAKAVCEVCANPYGQLGEHSEPADFTVVTQATCETAGLKTKTCQTAGCGELLESVTIDPCTHNWDSGEVTTAATCTSKGVMTYTCTIAESTEYAAHTHTRTEDINPIAHATEFVEANDATCTEPGNSAYWECTSCHKFFEDQAATTEITDKTSVEIEANGHDFTGTWVTSTNADGDQVHAKVCAACDATGLVVDGENVAGKTEKCSGGAATCQAKAVCEVCTNPYGQYGKHSEPADFTVVTQATCETAGLKTKTCQTAGCGELLESVTIDPCTHNWDSGEVTTAATCTSKGVMTYTCTIAESTEYAAHTHTRTEDIDPIAHATKFVKANDATCTADGNIAYWECASCHKFFTDEVATTEITDTASVVIKSTGHAMAKVEANDATCTEDGNYEYWSCSKCNKFFKDEDGNTETTVAKETISAAGHDMTATPAKASNCTETGNNAYWTCETCGKVYKDENGDVETTVAKETIDSLGHDIVGGTALAATCTTAGHTAGGSCSRCDYEEVQTIIPALGHDMKEDAAVPATCTTAGKEAGQHCSRCDLTTGGAVIPALNHDMKDDAAVPATCTTAGKEAGQHCSRCDLTTGGAVIPALGHDMTKTEAAEAECEATGNNEYYTCSTCKKVFKDAKGDTETSVEAETIPALNHAYDTTKSEDNLTRPVYDEEADTWSNGYYTHVCGNDESHTTKEYVDRADYADFEAAKADVEALLNVAGLTEAGRDKINAALNEAATLLLDRIATEQDVVDAATAKLRAVKAEIEANENNEYIEGCATGKHEFTEEKVVIIEATFDHTGIKANVCIHCGIELEGSRVEIPKLIHNHSEADWTIVTPATCTETGVRTLECKDCKDTFTEIIPALGHNYSDWIVDQAATCLATGSQHRTCDRCDKTETEVIPVSNTHHVIDYLGKEPTCEEPGLTSGRQCVDCHKWLIEQEIIPAKGHIDLNADGKCDTCHKEIHVSEGDCGCICHKTSFIMKLLYKFVLVFWKLFKIGKSCACGHVHY